MDPSRRKTGLTAALISALLLGMMPIFGKLAINAQFSPLAVVAARSTLAALLMMVFLAARMRAYFAIYSFGLWGCLLAGFVNGVGSILYYTALSRLDAGVGHILYSFYPLLMAGWLILSHHSITRLTVFRLALILPAIVLIMLPGHQAVDPAGALMMLGSALLYALHMLINQHILYEAPAQTVTLYTLIAMAVTVDAAFVLSGPSLPPQAASSLSIWYPLIGMAVITFLSRLTLFLGIKHLGGLQTAILGLAELLVTILLARFWLAEMLSLWQWLGCTLLAVSLLLFGRDQPGARQTIPAVWLRWLNPPMVTISDPFPPQSAAAPAVDPTPAHNLPREHS